MAHGSVKPRGKRSAIYGELAVPKSGRAAPVTIDLEVNPFDRAGFAPERLDPVIGTLISNAESCADLLQEYTPLLAGLMQRLQLEVAAFVEKLPKPDDAVLAAGSEAFPVALNVAMDMATKVAAILEKVNRMQMQSVKAQDDAARLRAFVATGDDETTGLAEMSDTQLRAIVADAAAGFANPESV